MVGRFLRMARKPEMAEDPVCHMQVDPTRSGGGSHEHQGQIYFFCGPGCRVAFTKEPDAYLSGEKRIEM